MPQIRLLADLQDHQVMPVALLVPEEEVFDLRRGNRSPVLRRRLAGEDRRVLVPVVVDAQGIERLIHVLRIGHLTNLSVSGRIRCERRLG